MPLEPIAETMYWHPVFHNDPAHHGCASASPPWPPTSDRRGSTASIPLIYRTAFPALAPGLGS